MAFNPFAGFAKYKRVWMGAVMILVMITFVLCTGTRGGMDEFLLRFFRFGGTPVISIDGSTLYRQDFDLLVRQRKVANDYMRIYARILIDEIGNRLRTFGEPKDDNAKQGVAQLSLFRDLLVKRTKEPKFFETGTKADELIDFRVWLAEADRLSIRLQPETLDAMVDFELYKRQITQLALGEGIYSVEAKVLGEVQKNHGFEFVNVAFVRKALENEYRVRIAQLGDAKFQLRTLDANFPKRINPRMDIPADQVRAAMTPGQLWDFYQENRKEFDVALLPVPVAEFASEIEEPDPRKLEDLFEKHKKTAFDPASDQPGFRKPNQIRVQYASADPNSAYFKRIARTSDFLTSYPIGSFVPQMPLVTALRFASAPLVTPGTLQIIYDNQLRYEQSQMGAQRFVRPYFLGASFLAGDIASPMEAWLAREQPLAQASYIGAMFRHDTIFAATPAYLAVGAWKYPDELKAGIEVESRRRVPLYATLVATGTMPTGLAVASELVVLADDRPADPSAWPFLPLPVIQKFLLERFDQSIASKYVTANMSFFKKKLEDENVAGKTAQVHRLLERYGPRKPGAPAVDGEFRDLGLEIAQTEKLYDRYTIKDAPELKPLLESFERYYTTINQIEGRESRPETILKDDDFWKMFFDGTESFSISGGKYHARPWPPVIKLGSPTQLQASKTLEIGSTNLQELVRMAENREPNKDATFNLFATSNRPFLVWKTDEKLSEVPDTLAEVKDRVVQAWKIQQARENKVLPYVKKLAESMLAGNADYASTLKQEPKFGQSVVTFDRLAPLYFERQHFGGPGIYTDYKLRRGAVNYPRDDMVSQLLALNDPEKLPIKVGIPDLDKLNAELAEKAKESKLPADKYLQVLTNKPRDTYYLAAVQFNRGASALEFYFTVLPGAAHFQDFLFDHAQLRTGANHLRELVGQLRISHRVEVHEAAKSYDTEGGS